ncbi:hypothetical protein G4Y79_14065 [Phototrophicus methaneseepsis]|uniref:Lipoprotein n=1 Tax=Phototrophicus methaneseepsis TaxID=2710758 RepID=A0A7S8IDI5_9CHLR|nr:PCYCGC motif-containing (lipo)protein [Phototrophicus methaneseepsis]QPC80833.1 hypothetical protein G4Y79_14065 [Phototrophicus methaneseepsis]
MISKRWLFLIFTFMGAILLAACSSSGIGSSYAGELPSYVSRAPQTVQTAYHFAIEHPEMLTHQPCYCGCGAMGHANNLNCFIQSVDEGGTITFDNHASGCGICVDIALDVKRLSEEGRSQLEIRHYIDATYGSFGPSTDTAMPEV